MQTNWRLGNCAFLADEVRLLVADITLLLPVDVEWQVILVVKAHLG